MAYLALGSRWRLQGTHRANASRDLAEEHKAPNMASFSSIIAKTTHKIARCRDDCANSMPTGKLISGPADDEIINTIAKEGISSLLTVEERTSDAAGNKI